MIRNEKLNSITDQRGAGDLTLPPPFHADQPRFRGNHRRLRGFVPAEFEAFYRANLRFMSGPRIRSSDVFRIYGAWAAAVGAPSLTQREIKRAMYNIGHRTVHSNGIHYCDVALASDAADLADNFPEFGMAGEAHSATMADRLAAMIAELSSMHAQVTGRAH